MKSRLRDTLLLVGNETSDRASLHDIFDPQYHLLEAETAEQGVLLLKQNMHCIAAMIADVPMKERQIRELIDASCPGTPMEVPVMVLVEAKTSYRMEERAFLLGAADVVVKPYTKLTIQRRLQVLVDLYLHRWNLERMLEDQNKLVRDTYQSILDTLSAMIERRDTESGHHVIRLRGLTKILLQEVAKHCPEYGLTEANIDAMSSASALHDIGKIGISDAILNKQGPLTKAEQEIMKSHTTIGSELVGHLQATGDLRYLRYAYNICLYHHERWDGSGYPKGLKGDEIPLCAQVVGMTDAFDALTTPRVYKTAYSYETAVNMILNGKCGAFSPVLLECFKQANPNLIRMAKRYAEGGNAISDEISLPLSSVEEMNVGPNALQFSQLKYHALLHHLSDTVIEIDLNNRTFHVVYNPDPNLVELLENVSYDELGERMMGMGIHPEDQQDIWQMQQDFADKLFTHKQRKCVFHCQIYNAYQKQHDPYEVSLIRVETGSEKQRMLLVLFHRLEGQRLGSGQAPKQFCVPSDLHPVSLQCRSDGEMTLMQDNILTVLTGYTEEEQAELFEKSFLNMILPEDRDTVKEMVQKSRQYGCRQEGQYRLLCRDGRTRWVLGKTRLAVDDSGAERQIHTLTDISSIKEAQEKQEALAFRNQVIIDQSTGVLFEWNIRQDRFICSEHWKARFGYDIQPEQFSRQLDVGSNVHPDDLIHLREKAKQMLQCATTESMEVRIANAEGRYGWSLIRATSVLDKDGNPTHIIGVIHNINDWKSDALAMRQQAQQDTLTRLMNKASVQQAAMKYLETRPEGNMAALLIVDMDNFKSVNDTYGHMYGDAVLTQMGTDLRSLFRSQDLIGRIGGDEFLILLRDIPGLDIAQDRCHLLVTTLSDKLHRLMPDLNISLSVGCALVPDHGRDWAELYRHADEALYTAKRQGKSQYAIYNRQEQYQTLVDPEIYSTRIDSNDQPSMDNDALMRFVFRSLYESRDMEASIHEVISFVGTHFNVSRVYIFENNQDNTCCSNTFEWCNTGIAPEKENLQNLSYLTDIPNWQGAYDETGILYCTDIQELAPVIRDVVEPQGIKSMLHCAIREQGVFRGFVGFDECHATCLWTQEQVSTLELLAQMLSVFLMKYRYEQKVFVNVLGKRRADE